ncbi:DNA-binding LacI/PurR family transcriptional regulator [Saccharothrix carnea]|uniref:DNA-binding LacI/PurR family transcriptional regulator n=1 Tax=Saccharothrix carnea TaxID=1280637 RepID=A0A2P8IBN7_SACCR|nr:substrate-binding domain-containing protein [Saccharothrix carnea]PSL55875.1 DNA-binding LacI/PurR family transcriptional regulator [Saccharothrix carnea]
MNSESRTLAAKRRASILEALHRDGVVRISDLSEQMGVTAVTLRRDIAHLDGEGLLRRVHGGATLPTADLLSPGVPPFEVVPEHLGAAGMLVPSLDYYWPEVVRGAEEEASGQGLRIRLRGSSYESADDRPQLERLLDNDDVCGLIAAPSLTAPSAAATIEWLSTIDTPVVLVERVATVGPRQAVMESVVSDHALGAAMAVHHLVSLGHRKVGVVTSENSPTSPHVHRGWLDACAETGLDPRSTVDTAVPAPGAPGWDTALDEVLDGLASTGTTAVLVHADTEAMALVQRAEQRGVKVPSGLSVVAYDDEVAALFTPALTAVRPARRSIGRAAVSLLAARLHDPDRPAHRVVITPSLRVRHSSVPPP